MFHFHTGCGRRRADIFTAGGLKSMSSVPERFVQIWAKSETHSLLTAIIFLPTAFVSYTKQLQTDLICFCPGPVSFGLLPLATIASAGSVFGTMEI